MDTITKPFTLEHCYSGFMGYKYMVFIWDGDKLVGSLCYKEDGTTKFMKGMKV